MDVVSYIFLYLERPFEAGLIRSKARLWSQGDPLSLRARASQRVESTDGQPEKSIRGRTRVHERSQKAAAINLSKWSCWDHIDPRLIKSERKN
jgi:hypothetical protein